MDFTDHDLVFVATFFFLIGVVVLGVAALSIWIYVSVHVGGRLSGWRLMRSLRKVGRTISPEEAAARMRRGEGIILLEGPSMGWPISRVWWSSDTSFLPHATKEERDHFCCREDCLNYERFIDLEKGCAKLVCPYIYGEKVRAYLAKWFGIEKDVLFIDTGGVFFSRHMEGKLRESG